MTTQLPLNFQLRDDATLESFCVGKNDELVEMLRREAEGVGEPFIYFWGNEAVGKTHLLQAVCHAASKNTLSAFYVPLREEATLLPGMLQGLEELSLVCLDDIDCVAGKPEWEEAVFHLFNRLQAKGGRLIAASHVSPKQLNVRLSDLKSRLCSGISYQLQVLSDEQKEQVIEARANQRGLKLNKAVCRFLLSRCPRDMNELFASLEKLDKASLMEQRKLTIPFVKQVLNL